MAERMMKERNLQSVTAKSRLGNGGAKFLTYLFLLVMAVIVLFIVISILQPLLQMNTMTRIRGSKKRIMMLTENRPSLQIRVMQL